MKFLIESPTYGNFEVEVDDGEDTLRVIKHTWCVMKSKKEDTFYIATSHSDGGKLSLHRFIMCYDGPLEIDHIDRNPMKNCRANLRIVTRQHNQFNKDGKGYHLTKGGKYRAAIRLNGKKIDLGTFSTEEEARPAYLKAKAIYHVIPPAQ